MFQARSSATQEIRDFYAHTDGSFWTSSDSSGKPIEVWLGGATAYCTIWYDQSGAGNNATQTDPALQPAVDYVNYAMDFTAQGGSSYFNLPSGTVPESVAYTVTVKHGVINNLNGGWLGGGVHNYNQANNFRRGSDRYVNYWWFNDLAGGTYAAGNTVTFKHDGLSVVRLYINGILTSSRAMDAGWNGVAGNEYLGQTMVFEPLNGVLYYLYIFKTALSDAKQSMIEAGVYGKVEVQTHNSHAYSLQAHSESFQTFLDFF